MYRQKVGPDRIRNQGSDGRKGEPTSRKGKRYAAKVPRAGRCPLEHRNHLWRGSNPEYGLCAAVLPLAGVRIRALSVGIFRRHAASSRRTARLALIPPKAKELLSAIRIGMGRASFGTGSTGHLGSAPLQLIVGGTILSRTAPMVTMSSSAPAAPRPCP